MKTGGNWALFEFFANPNPLNGYKPYRYDFEDFRGDRDHTKIFVTKLMRTHSGQCRSLPLLYKILANEIGAKAYIAYAPYHTFIRHRNEEDTRWINVELTNQSLPREIFIIETTGITQKAIEAGTYLKPCDDKEILLTLLAELAIAYLDKFEYIEDFVYKCAGLPLYYDPLNLHALFVINNCLYVMTTQRKMRLMEEGLPDDECQKDLVAQLTEVTAKIASTGFKEQSKEQYDRWIGEMEAEKERLKREGQ